MKAAIFEAVGKLAVKDVAEPQVTLPSDVKLKVLACGVCGTDLHILSDPPSHPGTIGAVLGHEFIAEVAEVGSAVANVTVGQRVAVRPIVSCGACSYCLSGALNHCTDWQVHGVFKDGGLAEFVVVPNTACLPISSDIPIEIAALTEPLACVMSAIRKIALFPGEDVVIFGAGAIGLIYLAILKNAGAGRIAVVELSETRAAVAMKMGASVVIDPTKTNLDEAVHKLMPKGADVVVDAVGSQLGNSLVVAGRRARVVLFGINTHSEANIKQHLITEKELTILGSFVGQQSFPDAIRLLESGTIDFSPIVSDVVALSDFESEFPRIKGGSVVKAIVTV